MPSRLAERHATLVLDASVLINLLGTGRAADLVRCLGVEVLAVEEAAREVEEDPSDGGPGAVALERLASAGLLRVVRLGPGPLGTYQDLAAGVGVGVVLGEGEAATIAYALHSGATAVLDDKQATRVARGLLSSEPPLCTLDLLASPRVEAALGRAGATDAMYEALVRAQIRVPAEFKEWLIAMVGRERLRGCPSVSPRWLDSPGARR